MAHSILGIRPRHIHQVNDAEHDHADDDGGDYSNLGISLTLLLRHHGRPADDHPPTGVPSTLTRRAHILPTS